MHVSFILHVSSHGPLCARGSSSSRVIINLLQFLEVQFSSSNTIVHNSPSE